MTNTAKTVATAGVVGAVALGGILFSATSTPPSLPDVATAKTPIEEKIDKDSELYQRVDKDTQKVIDDALQFIKKKEKNEGFTEQDVLDYEAIETQVDSLRQIHDTPELQRIDRVLETLDANEQWFGVEKQKLLDL